MPRWIIRLPRWLRGMAAPTGSSSYPYQHLHVIGDARGHIIELTCERRAGNDQFLLALSDELAPRHFVDQNCGKNLQDRQ